MSLSLNFILNVQTNLENFNFAFNPNNNSTNKLYKRKKMCYVQNNVVRKRLLNNNLSFQG